MSETRAVMDLSAVDMSMGESVGGKAANLGELIRAGFPVPPGFCLTTFAYDEVTAGVGDQVTKLLEELAVGEEKGLGEVAARMRAVLVEAPVPADLVDAVTAAYEDLSAAGPVPVAVRSSATAEDLPSASFAGQQDTYLNIIGADALLDAIRRCWASLWTERAVSYRLNNAIDHRAVRLAVVVQRMVSAEVAGVMFTANPMTGRRDETVVDAAPGLGEAVVSGGVTPDHFVVDTVTRTIRDSRVGDKRVSVRAREGGGTDTVELAEGDTAACVTDERVAELAALGERAQEHYGFPLDTEWAIDTEGVLWLTQARPITTLYPLPAKSTSGDDLRVYFSMNVAQGVLGPLTPMGSAGLRLVAGGAARTLGFDLADPLAGPPIMTEAGMRLWIDVTTAIRSKVGRAMLPRLLSQMEARSGVLLTKLFTTDARVPLTYPEVWPVVRSLARAAARAKAPLRIVQAILSPEAATKRAFRMATEIKDQGAGPSHATAVERLDFLTRMPRRVVGPRIVSLMPIVFPSVLLTVSLRNLLGEDATADEIHTVLRSVPHNVTTEMDLDLWRHATDLRDDPDAARALDERSPSELADRYSRGDLPPALAKALTEFLGTYGHRSVAEIDLGVPRWREDPTHVIGSLANYLRMTDPDRAPDVLFAAGREAAERKIDELVARVAKHHRLRARAVGFALRRTRALIGLRELPKYCLVTTLGHIRAQLLPIGAELAESGRLEQADDIFFLDLKKVRAAVGGQDMRAVVAERRAAFDRESLRRRVPRVLLSDGTDLDAAGGGEPAAEGDLVGSAASAGTVTGVARVVTDPAGAYLEPGEILVAPSTDPGWTPLFLTAGGLVMEMGGPSSHGAIVAREYGIPAVVGVPDALSRIHSGQRVTVDGSAGTITIHEE